METIEKPKIPDLLEIFKKAFEAVGPKGELIGNAILVSELHKEDLKKIGSLFIKKGEKFQVNAWDSNQPCFVKVLAVGKGYFDPETDKEIPCDLKPGNVIQVGKSSVNWFTSFGEIMRNPETGFGVGLTLEGETKMKFEDEEAYRIFMNHFDIFKADAGAL